MVSGNEENIEISIENLRAFTEDLRELSDTVKKYPSLILLGEPPEPVKPGNR